MQLATLPALSGHDQYLFREGTHARLYEKLGAQVLAEGGVRFAVWAPNAQSVSVVGDFNGWDPAANPMDPTEAGVWQAGIAGARAGSVYKYHVVAAHGAFRVDKADPYAFRSETPPRTASVVWDLSYQWGDADWMRDRKRANALDAPTSVYEVHLGSWRRDPANPSRILSFRELAPLLAEYCKRLGFTHVELMPVMEHPFYGSWGYQTTGYFAPSSRYGTPQDFMHFVDLLHQSGIGVILDWVPSHFPWDQHGLGFFDGTHLYEHADPRQGHHPDWASAIFNYGRNEVRAFLASSARFWLDRYHADGLRVDAVASMLYLDYSRKEGQWLPNVFGGREDLEAVAFLKELNELVHAREPGVISAAEESTAWPGVSRPTYMGGLGFGFKWNMGWMHDTLGYFEQDPIHRRYHHHELTFSLVYAWTENFILPLSHDEVVHGKGSLLQKMPGDRWQQLANLRALYAYMWAHPGKKLLFMGGEIASPWEWSETAELPWWLLEHADHAGMRDLVRDLNRLYRAEPALWEVDFSHEGFVWIEPNDASNNVIAFMRVSRDGSNQVVCVANLSPVPREGYRVGLPQGGPWEELLNTDSAYYGGTGVGNLGEVDADGRGWHGQRFSAEVTLPPLSVLWLRPAPA
jgi:1,4-alpha-glucan branching enzyme